MQISITQIFFFFFVTVMILPGFCQNRKILVLMNFGIALRGTNTKFLSHGLSL